MTTRVRFMLARHRATETARKQTAKAHAKFKLAPDLLTFLSVRSVAQVDLKIKQHEFSGVILVGSLSVAALISHVAPQIPLLNGCSPSSGTCGAEGDAVKRQQCQAESK